MASVINKIHGAIMKPITSVSEAISPVAVGPATYLWRAKILLNRVSSLKSQRIVTPLEVDPAKLNINTRVSELKQKERQIRIKLPKPIKLNNPTVSTIHNTITIINPNAKASGTSYESVVIQGMPKEINMSSENTWVAIKSPGRNNAMYAYMGSEDTLDFEISWYAIEANRQDVIKRCRLLESWSKADGYNASPPELWISWGNAELFKDETFILVSAPYILSNFQNSCRKSRTSPIVDLGLLPNAATQKLTFKRVTKDNLTHLDIQRVKGDVPTELPATSVEPNKKPDKFER